MIASAEVARGKEFGRLTVIAGAGRLGADRRRAWLCRCVCGAERTVLQKHLVSGHTSSCGCLKGLKRTRHGHRCRGVSSKTYDAWASMTQRCYDPKCDSYQLYGGRGIRVCDRWRDFACFLEDMGERPEGMSLDRFPDADGDYRPGNARWATAIQQANNKRNNVRITHGGRTLTIAEWSRETGIPFFCIYARLFKLGWHPSDAITKPSRKGKLSHGILKSSAS
jgi:hypothetical protein